MEPTTRLAEAKAQFIHLWGVSGSRRGVSKMAQLTISRENASLTVRELLDWGLICKELRAGERREYFAAEKDVRQVTRCIIRARKRRELDQMKRRPDQLAAVPGDAAAAEYQAFYAVLTDIQQVATASDKMLMRLMRAERNWFWDKFIRLFM